MTKGYSRELKELKTELNKITGLERVSMLHYQLNCSLYIYYVNYLEL